jgi:hypothetical protein
MRSPLLYPLHGLAIAATATPPRDRTTRGLKAAMHCRDEWTRAYEQATTTGHASTKALRMAAVAYKLAMPEMDSLPAIRACITCIAQGIRLEVFDGRDGSQLLYAAQVALSLLKNPKLK